MGKKTEEMMTKLDAALIQWKSLDVNFSAGQAKLAAAVSLRNQKQAAKDKYYTAKGWGGQKAGREEAMMADAAFQKMEDEWLAEYSKAEKIFNALEALKPGMRTARGKVQELLAVFEKFVNEKDKRITDPNKKKSVPAARELIKKVHAAMG